MAKNSVIVEGVKYSWVRVINMVAHDLGLPAGRYKMGFVAARACERKGWTNVGAKQTLRRYGIELLIAGKRPRAYTEYKFSPRPVAKRHPEIPALGAPHPDYTKDDGFYNSREWRQLRYLALKNTDGRCGCCGASASDGIRIHVDHIQPRYKRPDLSLDLANLQVLCEDCNCGKGAWDQTDWRAKF